MTIEPEEYVALNQPDNESPSTVSYIQDNYENLKNKIINIGLVICAFMLLLVNITDLISGLVMINNCTEDTYTPAYFIVAGLIGAVAKSGHIVIQQNKRLPKIYQIFYPFYVFEFFWLIAGAYYYVITYPEREGCSKSTYSLAYWLIITTCISLTILIVIFCWALTMIFSLVYFKNKIVQFLAKSMRF
ncbi:hypothetical protein ILUMI_13610 [Ignelater luminosus]|uniref:Uncharacterized protein n=1 Tax=Ignelater luminosus TaxID=2038154 RepID=A0A8K0CXH2_IGNLU|nr:hypothetical protein ILUMI_13610 [Ignelater luminosus]